MIYINLAALGLAALAFYIARRANSRMEKVRARQSIKDAEIDKFVEAVFDHMVMEFKHDRLSYERVAQLIQGIPNENLKKAAYAHLQNTAQKKSLATCEENKVLRYRNDKNL